MKFRSKVVEIEAVQLLWANWSEVCELSQTSLRGQGLRGLNTEQVKQQFPDAEFAEWLDGEKIYAVIPTLEGPHLAREGDWIIRGTEGELYPCKPSVFERKYEVIPNMTDQSLEQEIKAKGLTAPRVTTADVDHAIVGETYTVLPSGRTTICELTLRNGFTVRGESSCVSIENFDAEIGRRISREDARQKIWQLEGYLLRERLFQAKQPAQAAP